MPPIEKKHKLSAFSDTEIIRLLASLIDFQDKSPDVSLEGDKEIVHLVDKLKDALSHAKYYPFSSATLETLERAGIVRVVKRSPLDPYDIDDPTTLAKHAARYRAMLAEGAFLSADNFDGLFNTIVRHVSTITDAGSRLLVDAFLLRVAAMEDQGLLLIFPEYMVPITQLSGPDDTLAVAGKLDYLLVLISEDQKNAAVSFLKNPRDPVEEGAKGFAIVQAKPTLYPILSDAIPQAVLEVAAFAKKQKKMLMNGVVTNGLEWMFFSFTPGPDGVGGTFERSRQVSASSPELRAVITGVLKDMIAGTSTVVRLPAVPSTQETA
ncbi:hypothetical protein K466DRAFT_593936 [Polyporus arcularius HHB13444]|uniref:Uncharacterized protein n=1 Tax=Polyporus arcularius HHB13444 TaxID=1314778 RepID=A0A5C3PVS3_9APHY|nr:hypothetical protein K466DRAFT_593936 [Polyporus arcularius HHB13444]